MFQKILVALDNSAFSQDIFDEALSVAKAHHATLMLLHVLSNEETGSPNMPIFPSIEYYPAVNEKNMELYREQWQAFEQKGLELLQSLAEKAIAAGVNTEYTQNSGTPGQNICDLARAWDADLIITGRRGRSGLSEFFLGSVSNYVLHHAPCSVLTLQHSTEIKTKAEVKASVV
jgi:nucleotide-binding universal stress UspA family protein